MNADLLAAALKLSPGDRLELIEALWDTLADEDLPITPEERALLDERLVDLERTPNDQSSWDEAVVDTFRLHPSSGRVRRGEGRRLVDGQRPGHRERLPTGHYLSQRTIVYALIRCESSGTCQRRGQIFRPMGLASLRRRRSSMMTSR